MKTIKTQYKGHLSAATETPLSENPVLTEAPTFGPMSLLTASYASCILSFTDFMAQQNQFNTTDTTAELSYKENAEGSKLTDVDINLFFKGAYTAEQKEIIEKAAKSCPVRNSLHPDVKLTYNFIYE